VCIDHGFDQRCGAVIRVVTPGPSVIKGNQKPYYSPHYIPRYGTSSLLFVA